MSCDAPRSGYRACAVPSVYAHTLDSAPYYLARSADRDKRLPKFGHPRPHLLAAGTLVDCASVDRYPPAASSSRGYTLLHLPLTLEGAWRPLDDLQLPTTPPNSLPLSAVCPGSSDATFPNRVTSKVDKVNIKPLIRSITDLAG